MGFYNLQFFIPRTFAANVSFLLVKFITVFAPYQLEVRLNIINNSISNGEITPVTHWFSAIYRDPMMCACVPLIVILISKLQRSRRPDAVFFLFGTLFFSHAKPTKAGRRQGAKQNDEAMFWWPKMKVCLKNTYLYNIIYKYISR